MAAQPRRRRRRKAVASDATAILLLNMYICKQKDGHKLMSSECNLCHSFPNHRDIYDLSVSRWAGFFSLFCLDSVAAFYVTELIITEAPAETP